MVSDRLGTFSLVFVDKQVEGISHVSSIVNILFVQYINK